MVSPSGMLLFPPQLIQYFFQMSQVLFDRCPQNHD